MPERKYMSYIFVNCFDKRSYQQSFKAELGGALDNRAYAIKNYKKYEHKWKKELKPLKKQNKMIFSVSKKSGSSRKLNNINKISAKASNKCSYPSSKISIGDSDLDSSLSIYSG